MIKEARQNLDDIHLEVATTEDGIKHAIAIRAICFVDAGLPFQQAFDGNDFQATHILAYYKQEPIGATRIRWFRDFAKIERTAFRKEFRNARVLRHCCSFIFEHVARKGYDLLLTQADPTLARMWKMILGFETIEGRDPVLTPGHEPYVELIKKLPRSNEAITLQTDPTVLLRVEGRWDEPGPLEIAWGQ